MQAQDHLRFSLAGALPLRVAQGEPPHRVECLAVPCGRDLVVICGGGTSYHTGAVAVGWAHLALKDPARITSSASVVTLTGHKEDLLARSAALRLSRALVCTVTVAVGIHVDDATSDEIDQLTTSFNGCVETLLVSLTNPQAGRGEAGSLSKD